MRGKAELLAHPNEPLGRVVLVPLNGIAVVHGELMVEVVVALSYCYKRSDEMVFGGVFVVERCLAQPVRERIHAES